MSAIKQRSGIAGRIHANEDLVEAVEQLVLVAGVTNATVQSSIGSLVGARLNTPGGRIEVAGPAAEVIHLSGVVRSDASGRPRAELSAVLVDMEGAVYAGELIRGENPISLTFEVTLEAWRTPFGA